MIFWDHAKSIRQIKIQTILKQETKFTTLSQRKSIFRDITRNVAGKTGYYAEYFMQYAEYFFDSVDEMIL